MPNIDFIEGCPKINARSNRGESGCPDSLEEGRFPEAESRFPLCSPDLQFRAIRGGLFTGREALLKIGFFIFVIDLGQGGGQVFLGVGALLLIEVEFAEAEARRERAGF
jgi:hypothetical protein